jgi:starch synthase
MDVLMVAAELGPYERSTEASDAIPALAKVLRQLGHRVTVALPRYGSFEAHGLLVARRLTPLPVPGGEVTVYDGQLSSGVELCLFDLPHLDLVRSSAPDATLDGKAVEHYLALGRAAAALARQRRDQQALDVIHAHDWAGGLVAPFLETPVPVVLTTYDARRAGFLEPAAEAALPPSLAARFAIDGRAAALQAALGGARVVATCSTTHAAALDDPRVGGALSKTFSALAEPPAGVMNGIDYAVYNPAIDPALDARFDAEDPFTKARTKGAILRQLRLDLEILRPLAVFSAPLDREHGADVLLAALPELMRQNLSLIVAGEGDPEIVAGFRAARSERPEAVALVERPDDAQARRLLAAADLALVIERRAPAATAQLVAQRYGVLPVALAAGAVRDTVVDCDPSLETGTGFLFDRAEPAELVGAVERALSAYADEDAWARLRRRVMRLDLGWDRAARRYLQLYRRAVELASS